MKDETPRRPSFADRRSAIIDATVRVIERKGIRGATMRAIAQELGLTTGVITHHFSDKSELLSEALQTCFTPWIKTLESGKKLADPWERLRHLFFSTLPTFHKRRARVQVWLGMLQQLDREPSLKREYQQNYGLIRDEVAATFQECQERGFICADFDKTVECNRLFALSDGLVVSALAEPDRYDATMLQRIMEWHFDALRAPSARKRATA